VKVYYIDLITKSSRLVWGDTRTSDFVFDAEAARDKSAAFLSCTEGLPASQALALSNGQSLGVWRPVNMGFILLPSLLAHMRSCVEAW